MRFVNVFNVDELVFEIVVVIEFEVYLFRIFVLVVDIEVL